MMIIIIIIFWVGAHNGDICKNIFFGVFATYAPHSFFFEIGICMR